MYCMHCGEQIADDSRYCRYCGRLVAEDEIRPAAPAEPENEQGREELSASSDEQYGGDTEENAEITEEGTAEHTAVNTAEIAPEVITEDDLFLEHVSRGKKILLFMVAVILTVIVAVIVFTALYPELV